MRPPRDREPVERRANHFAGVSPGPRAGAALEVVVAAPALEPADIESRGSAIHSAVIARSPHVRERNFTEIAAADLELLFGLYDEGFFAGALARALGGNGDGRLRFRLSSRMTSAGGKVYVRHPGGQKDKATYEIAVSTHLLFLNFGESASPAAINGRQCGDRLEALQRVFEHELVHLAEFLLTGRSSCRGAFFRSVARRLFGHTETTHRLVTMREKALVDHGIRVGAPVAFTLDGVRHEGLVNRITKRATVLVEDEDGVRYSDGRRYLKYYVPLGRLEPR